ncbi:MAG: thioether cross-link-forming SCIFF peptide maturase [Dorea sp.]|nr:thioether cross-link-forming SCIFF peptide maturase [Dorea sp.]MDE6936593.1 thioether cross-link-forming SCIFF peptide maturase [Lachnospiraceae bacterium]
MIHQYQNNGYNIVMDVVSGAVHVVDEVCYDVISGICKLKEAGGLTLSDGQAVCAGCEADGGCRGKSEIPAEALKASGVLEKLGAELLDRYSETEIREALLEVIGLTEAGQLFVEDTYECMIEEVKKRKTVVKALCLHIAHDCNLACRYCFAEEGEYHGRRALMSLETGKKALDFLIACSGGRHNLEVDFFGGEPLMNWQVVKELVAYGREQEKIHDKHFRFTLTTNGVLLNDEVQEFVNREMDNVVLSLDGRREVNDKMRPFRNGAGSYDLIVPKFQKLADSRDQERYYVRGTFTRENLDFSEDILHFADLGFKQMSIEPVVGDESDPYAIRKSDLPAIMDEYDKLAKIMIEREKEGKGFNFFHFMIDLDGGPCVAKRLSGCGSGTEYLAVTPWGDLYPCHQFVGQEEFLMGNVDEGIVKPKIADDFRGCNVYSKEKCRDCFAKFYCSGGCMANAYNFHGTIHDTYDIGCEMQRKRVECAIMIKAALAEEA